MSFPPPPGPHDPFSAPPPGPREAPAHPAHPAQPQPWYPPSLYPSPYPPPGRPPVNGLAIASLVLGLFCCLPGVGLVLGLVGLRQIGRTGERGRGMAVAGAVLSSAGVLLWAAVLSTGAASEFWKGVEEAAMEDVAVAEGQCFDAPGGSLEGMTYDLDVVPCSGEHDGEVFAGVTLPGDAFPGEDRVAKIADDRCYALQDDYAMDSWALPSHVDVYYLTPTRQSWRLGDREIACFFGNTAEGGTLTGSLRNDETTLDADQLAYLEVFRAVDAVLEKEPEEFPEEDLAGNRAWAGEVRDTLAEQSRALAAHAWPADAERPLARLVKDLDAARDDWAKAARADSADDFFLHYDEAYAFYDGPSALDAREALGLDSSPPEYDYDPGGDTDAEV